MSRRLHIALFLLSLSLIALQLVLMQILSIVQWYHFASMVISMALLAFGASGTLLSLGREWFLGRIEVVLPLCMMLSGITMPLAYSATQLGPFRFDAYLLFVDTGQLGSLVATYVFWFVPFFFGATAIGLALVAQVHRAGTLYFANMVGSGMGGLVGLGLMWVLLPQQLPGAVGMLALGAGLVLAGQRTSLIAIAVAGLFVCGWSIVVPSSPVLSEYKSLSRTLKLPEAAIVAESASPHGLLQLTRAQGLRYAPGLSLTYDGQIPVTAAVFNNADWLGPVAPWSGEDATNLLDYSTHALAFEMGRRDRVLVLLAGTGLQVAQAITRGASEVVAVEPNSEIAPLIGQDSSAAGLFLHPAVRLVHADPRNHLRKDTSFYDLISVPFLDAFGGAAGVYALREQYWLTIEAFEAMWERLSPDGVLSVTSWIDYPVRTPLRTLATLVEMLERAGIEHAETHLIAVRGWGTITFVAKKSGVAQADLERTRGFCERMQFDPALLPDLRPEERVRYNDPGDRSLFLYMDQITGGETESLFESYGFNLRPATDNRPYFSQFLQWKSIRQLTNLFGRQGMPFLELGYLVIIVTMVQVVLFALVLVLLPLLRGKELSKRMIWLVVLFGAIGVAYMFMEIVFIQQLMLHLGRPVYAAAAVICTMLVCSGMGSYISQRLRPLPRNLTLVLLTVVVLILGYVLFQGPTLKGISTSSLRVGAALVMVAVPAFLMGMPFPLGMRVLSIDQRGQLAWAWGINGCASVVSTASATVMAVECGFTVVILTSAVLYAIAALSARHL